MVDKLFDVLLAELLSAATLDHIGLWEILAGIEARYPLDQSQIELQALEFIPRMLIAGFVAGSFEKNIFIPWADQDARAVTERISHDWRALGRRPSVGDIVEFVLPDKIRRKLLWVARSPEEAFSKGKADASEATLNQAPTYSTAFKPPQNYRDEYFSGWMSVTKS